MLDDIKHVVGQCFLILCFLTSLYIIFAKAEELQAQQRAVSRCKLYMFKETLDSTYYEVQCGQKVKVKAIVESD